MVFYTRCDRVFKTLLTVKMTLMYDILIADLTEEMPVAVRLQRLAGVLRKQFRCGAVALLQLDNDTLQPVATDGLVREALGRRFALYQHPRLAAILSGHGPVCFPQDASLPDPYDGLLEACAGEPLPVHDCMGITLQLEGQPWGVLTLDSLEPGTFTPAAQQALAAMTPIVEAAVRVSALEQERRHLRLLHQQDGASDPRAPVSSEIIGHSPAIQQLLHEIDIVAASELPVLLTGETGVGKELFARRLHQRSPRHQKPLIHVNCAALPESLAESELFGHAKGAFSGAGGERPGRVEAANGGTLFLDEVGELPLPVQAKLLRTLQNGEIQRLGEDRPRRVDVRIIAATNRQLQQRVREGQFRADLYHRLSVYPVPIPPLRERGHDILLIAGHFLELNRSRLGLRSLRLSPDAESALLRYAWPGNVRELEHVISRGALKAISRGANRTDIVTLDARLLDLDSSQLPSPASAQPAQSPLPSLPAQTLKQATDACQRQLLQQALERHHHNWAAAARELAVDPSNLHKLARRLGLKAPPAGRQSS